MQASRINDYGCRVDFSLPARYEYIAASRYFKATSPVAEEKTFHDLDSYAFLSVINKIKIELAVTHLNEETEDVSYVLDAGGNLTTPGEKEHPLTFDKNEFITLNTTWAAVPWTEAMSKYLLEKFQNGKHLVECEVPARWALEHNVHINTEVVIRLQDDSKISRDGKDVVFQVKTIEKNYKQGRFYYSLGLMEV